MDEKINRMISQKNNRMIGQFEEKKKKKTSRMMSVLVRRVLF